jgi:hypothetical protein
LEFGRLMAQPLGHHARGLRFAEKGADFFD